MKACRGKLLSALLPLLLIHGEVWVAAAAPSQEAGEEQGCLGRWVGVGQNSGSSSPWTIDLNLESTPNGGRCGTIEYRNPACGGTLEACRVAGDSIQAQERYTHNDGNCAPPGRLILRCRDDKRMDYSWLGWERVNSVLTRPGSGSAAQSGSAESSSAPDRAGPPASRPTPPSMPPSSPPRPSGPQPPSGSSGSDQPPASGSGGGCAAGFF